MGRELQRTASVVSVDFARGAVPIGCDAGFYRAMLAALTDTLTRLHSQVPEGRELTEIETVVCEDGRSLSTSGYLDGNEWRYAQIVVSIDGLEYDRGNALTHPVVIDNALRWLATNQKALN